MAAGAIGIDVGSTNVKAVLVDGDGDVVAFARRRLVSEIDGDVAEQDAHVTWDAVLDCLRELIAAQPSAAAQVATIGVCSQYSSIVPVDADGVPVAPMVMWSDKRGTDHSFNILGEHEAAFMTWIERHGIPPVGGGLALAHILHLQHDRPDVHATTRWWLEPMDYITMRLTGVASATQASMFMSQLCDSNTVGVTEYEPGLVEMSGVDADRLPPLLAPGSAVGTITSAVAEDVGLPADAVVYVGTNDTATGAIATGAFVDDQAGLAIGTTTVLIDSLQAMAVDLEHEILAVPSPLPDTYLLMAENGIGGLALEHVIAEIVHGSDAFADHRVDNQFAQLDAALGSVDPGCGGAMFLPWLKGSQSPNANGKLRGGFINLSLDTHRVDLVRATAEGIAHNLRWLFPFAEEFTGTKMDDIGFVGGAARSKVWCQILADVLDRAISPIADPDRAVAQGAAHLAQYHHGLIDRDALVARPATAGRYEPNPALRQMYDEMHEMFDASRVALTPIYEKANS